MLSVTEVNLQRQKTNERTSMFIAGGEPIAVKPSSTRIVSRFLVPPGSKFQSAWVLAQAGMNNNGAARIRLVDDMGQALSDYTETFSSQVTRLKLTNVAINVPENGFPQAVSIEVENRSRVERSNASVHGVLLLSE